jgi:UDP-N-acetylmuramate--alanine ligase
MNQFYFIGIKGSGMSALACILHDEGNRVYGSDIDDYVFTEKELKKRAIKCYSFESKAIISSDTVIIGNAFSDDHPDVLEAKEKGCTCIRYHYFLRNWMTRFSSIAVSGTHGKTTTTGLLSHVFSNQVPTNYLIGDGTGVGKKEAQRFVFEACEYKNHFHSYNPDYAILTNIEWDHPDYFSSPEEVIKSFQLFSEKVQKGLVVFGDDEYIQSLQFPPKIKIMTYGMAEKNDIYPKNISSTKKGTKFTAVFKEEEKEIDVFIPMHGTHQILNTMAVLLMTRQNGLSIEKAVDSLQTFPGVNRRFQVTETEQYTIINDYAHHPTEIKATIESVRKRYPDRPVAAIFQPHTFTRTKTFLHPFQEALKEADKVFITDIFGSAREEKGDIDIHSWINQQKFQHLSLAKTSLLSNYNNHVLCFMGAGDIETYISETEKSLKNKKTGAS